MGESVTASGPGPAPNRKGAELRATPRHSCSLAALVQLVIPASRQRIFAWVHDISAGGVSLDVRSRLEPGQEFVCRLKGARPDATFEVAIQVVHSQLCDGLFRSGCKFALPLPASQLEAVLRKLRG